MYVQLDKCDKILLTLNKKIVFLHVPKSGGNTFNFALKRISKLNDINFVQVGQRISLPNFSLKYFGTDVTGIYSGHFVFSNELKKFDNFSLIRDVYKTFFLRLIRPPSSSFSEAVTFLELF